MNNYSVDFHVYGYDKNVGELVSAKDAESAIAAIGADIQIDNEKLKAKVAVLEQALSKPCRACESIRKLDEALGINELAKQLKEHKGDE